jgi:DNA polymerase I-like protein with 3'-5' exonuclease and polymerase domains
MQIHDAIIGLLPIDKHEQLYPQVANMMSTAVPLLVKTPVGIKRGFNLGEMEEVC